MAGGAQDVRITFKVVGSDLDAYLSSIKRKSEELANSAIRDAMAQSDKGRDQIRIINEQIQLLQRKAQIESHVTRSLMMGSTESQLAQNRAQYTARKNAVYADTSLSESAKREKITALEGGESANAERIKNDYRENLRSVKETERQSKIQTQLSLEQIATIRQTARENVKAISQGDLKLADVINDAKTAEEKLVANLTHEGANKEKKNEEKESSHDEPGGKGFFSSLLALNNLNRGVGALSQVGRAKTGFDLISPGAELTGQLTGALIGTFAGNSSLWSSIFGAMGKAAGEHLEMNARAKEIFYGNTNRYRATTGQDLTQIANLQGIGVSANENVNYQTEYARRRGYADGGKTVNDALMYQKGYGVDQSTSNGLIDIQRSSKEGNRDLAQLIGGILQKGQADIFKNDTSFLNEFLGKFTGLQKELLKTNTNVPTGTTMDIMQRFNSLGGEFSASDPRSENLISTVNSSLASPNTDMKKALSYYAIKKAHPNMGMADIMEEQQKGLASPDYLKNMMSMVDGMGGTDDTKRLNFAGLLGLEGNQKFATDIYRGYKAGKFKNGFSAAELKKLDSTLGSKAEGNTTQMERQTARGEDRTLSQAFSSDNIKQIVDDFKKAVDQAFSGAVIVTGDGGSVQFIKQNQPKSSNSPHK